MDNILNELKELEDLLEVKKKIQIIESKLLKYYKKSKYIKKIKLEDSPEKYINVLFDNLEEARSMYILHALLSGKIDILKLLGIHSKLNVDVISPTSVKVYSNNLVPVDNAIVWAFEPSTSELVILFPSSEKGVYESQVELPENGVIFAKVAEGSMVVYGYRTIPSQLHKPKKISESELDARSTDSSAEIVMGEALKKHERHIKTLINAQAVITLSEIENLLSISEEDIKKIFERIAKDEKTVIYDPSRNIIINLNRLYDQIRDVLMYNFGLMKYDELCEYVLRNILKNHMNLEFAGELIRILQKEGLIKITKNYIYSKEIIKSKIYELKSKGLTEENIKNEFINNFNRRKLLCPDEVWDIIDGYIMFGG